MKKILLPVVLATTLALTSCQFDDSDIWNKFGEMEESIRDHEQRISALEELCKQMNTNIEALQTLVNALEKRDYITNISPIREDGEVIGYTISFGKSDTITIYHGKDGQDGANGADGKDGYTPQIGVMKDTDNNYYWTLDGEWLLDGKGNKIQANGVNGTDGTNGSNGTNGTNGVTPQLKIENDYWYVSYDKGATWVQLGKATGEDGKDGQDGNDGADGSDGADGEDGKDGDSIFKSVTQDDEYVYFNLADGTMITLPKHDKENIQFEDLQVKAICCKNWDTNNDGELSYAEAAAVTDIGGVFSGNANIIAFTELKYFTGLTEIPVAAFEECTALWKVILPENVTTIEANAFHSCNSLSSITINKKLGFVGGWAFMSCNSLGRVNISDLLAWCKIDFTDGYSNPLFYAKHIYLNGKLITDLIIPSDITEIKPYTFYRCESLTSVMLPNTITKIDRYAFYDCCNLNDIYCQSINPPTIYYFYYSGGDQGSFPFNSEMSIYVPRNSYNSYMQYSSYDSNKVAQTNWYKYESYIQPYDFE